MKNKLKSQKGESLSEVLVASLVILLAFLLMHSAVVSSSRIIRRADDRYAHLVEKHNRLNRHEPTYRMETPGEMVLEMNGNRAEIAVDVYRAPDKKNGRQEENVVFRYRKKEK